MLGPAGGTFHGESVDGTAVLVKYTFAGDANLDGKINGDDYFAIDSGYAAHASGYANGDFNYDGRIDADDYFLIDANASRGQTTTGTGAATAVAEELPRVTFSEARVGGWDAFDGSHGKDVLDVAVVCGVQELRGLRMRCGLWFFLLELERGCW